MAKSRNFDAEWISTASPGAAESEWSVTHALGRTPNSFIVARRAGGAGTLRPGAAAWTSTTVSWLSDTALMRFLVLLY